MSQYSYEIAKLYKHAKKLGPGVKSPAQCGFIAVRDHAEWKRLRGGK